MCEISRYDELGVETTYEFQPEHGRTYTQSFEVWKGFDEGQREVHFDVKHNLWCKRYVFSVDLSAYVEAGWKIVQEPQVYVHSLDIDDDRLREDRTFTTRIEPVDADPAGKWHGAVDNFRGGLVDAAWDVAEGGRQQVG